MNTIKDISHSCVLPYYCIIVLTIQGSKFGCEGYPYIWCHVFPCCFHRVIGVLPISIRCAQPPPPPQYLTSNL